MVLHGFIQSAIKHEKKIVAQLFTGRCKGETSLYKVIWKHISKKKLFWFRRVVWICWIFERKKYLRFFSRCTRCKNNSEKYEHRGSWKRKLRVVKGVQVDPRTTLSFPKVTTVQTWRIFHRKFSHPLILHGSVLRRRPTTKQATDLNSFLCLAFLTLYKK